MNAGVHHHDVVTVLQQEFGLTNDADAIVRDAMEK